MHDFGLEILAALDFFALHGFSFPRDLLSKPGDFPSLAVCFSWPR